MRTFFSDNHCKTLNQKLKISLLEHRELLIGWWRSSTRSPYMHHKAFEFTKSRWITLWKQFTCPDKIFILSERKSYWEGIFVQKNITIANPSQHYLYIISSALGKTHFSIFSTSGYLEAFHWTSVVPTFTWSLRIVDILTSSWTGSTEYHRGKTELLKQCLSLCILISYCFAEKRQKCWLVERSWLHLCGKRKYHMERKIYQEV